MVVEQRWCRVHGERVTATLASGGEYRCDAPAMHGRQRLCDMPLEPLEAHEDGDEDDADATSSYALTDEGRP